MSTDQMRFNNGKAKLTYPFSSSRAWKLVRASFALEQYDDGLLYDDDEVEISEQLVVNITDYLGRGTNDLTAAFVDCLNLLQRDLTGVEPGYAETFAGFLADNVKSLQALANVFVYGEQKYARGNYRKGASVTSYLDSALRHLVFGYLTGERNDKESGLPHLAHVAWNLLVAMDQPASRDDRLPAVHDPANDEPLTFVDEAPFVQKLQTKGLEVKPQFDWVPAFDYSGFCTAYDAQKCEIGGYVLRVYGDLDVEVNTAEQDQIGPAFVKSYAKDIEGAKRFAEGLYLFRSNGGQKKV